MQISTAPIIHARTKDVDFRSNLLIVPDNFTAYTTAWCRKFITESTRYFETVGKEGRRILFCNDDIVVIGLSIIIQDLYDLCQRSPRYHLVDGTRTNYAFLGFVFPRSEIKHPFEIPYSMFLDQYQEYMDLRWNDSGSSKDSLIATRIPFEYKDFPEAKSISALLPKDSPKSKLIFNTADATQDEIIAEIISKLASGSHLSFCSNLPNATSFIDSHFDIGTSVHHTKIKEQILSSFEEPPSVASTADPSIEYEYSFSFSQKVSIPPYHNTHVNMGSETQTPPNPSPKNTKSVESKHESTFTQLQNIVGSTESAQNSDENRFSSTVGMVKEKIRQIPASNIPSFGSLFRKNKNEDIEESSGTPFSSYGYFKK